MASGEDENKEDRQNNTGTDGARNSSPIEGVQLSLTFWGSDQRRCGWFMAPGF